MIIPQLSRSFGCHCWAMLDSIVGMGMGTPRHPEACHSWPSDFSIRCALHRHNSTVICPGKPTMSTNMKAWPAEQLWSQEPGLPNIKRSLGMPSELPQQGELLSSPATSRSLERLALIRDMLWQVLLEHAWQTSSQKARGLEVPMGLQFRKPLVYSQWDSQVNKTKST